MEKFKDLLSKSSIGKMELQNRVIMPAMATNLVDSNGNVTNELVRYYVERAKGKTGLIIIENANIDFPQGANGAVQLRIDEDRFIPGLARLREELSDVNPECKIAIQINHPGAQTKASRTRGLQVVGPSNIPTRENSETPRSLTIKEIEDLIDKFANGALRAKRAGFDAIEIHGGFCYLLGQFISPLYNKRTDQFGGSIENRIRFPLMIINKARELVGDDFSILFRLNGDEFIKGGLTLEMAKENAKILEKASVDLLHITAGNGYRISKHIETMSYEEGWKVYLASEIKKIVNIPVATVGVIREPIMANEIISSGKADFVAIGRGLIADPYWVKKIYDNEENRINKCISCYECATRRLFLDLPVRCTVNPEMGRENFNTENKKSFNDKKKIMIVGGGPAGMRAAIEGKKEGYEVILFEKEDRLGGKGITAQVPPNKNKIGWLIDLLKNELKYYNIEIKLNELVNSKIVKEQMPDIIIIATGAREFIPSIPGIENSRHITSEKFLMDANLLKNKVVGIIGGGSVGCECAEYAVNNANKTIIFEMLDDVAKDLNPIARQELIDRLKENNVEIITNCKIDSVSKEKIKYNVNEEKKESLVDIIVVAAGSLPNRVLSNELKENNIKIPTYIIGDSYRTGKIIDTQSQAYTIIKRINEN